VIDAHGWSLTTARLQLVATRSGSYFEQSINAVNSMLIDLKSKSESQTTFYSSPNHISNNIETDNSILINSSTNSVGKHMKTNFQNISVQAPNNFPSTQKPTQTPKRPASSNSSTSASINPLIVNNQINGATSQIITQTQQTKKGTLITKLQDSVKTYQPPLTNQTTLT